MQIGGVPFEEACGNFSYVRTRIWKVVKEYGRAKERLL